MCQGLVCTAKIRSLIFLKVCWVIGGTLYNTTRKFYIKSHQTTFSSNDKIWFGYLEWNFRFQKTASSSKTRSELFSLFDINIFVPRKSHQKPHSYTSLTIELTSSLLIKYFVLRLVIILHPKNSRLITYTIIKLEYHKLSWAFVENRDWKVGYISKVFLFFF